MGIFSMLGNSLPVIASTFQTIYNAAQQRRNQKTQNDMNMKMAELQYNRELEMWNKANEYNTPTAQMQRFKDAGLNPNLIYGQGTPGNSPNVLPQFNAPTQRTDKIPWTDLPATLSAYNDFRVKNAQIDNLKEQNQNLVAQRVLTLSKARDQEAKNWFNFGNIPMSTYATNSESGTNFDILQQMKKYQLEVLRQTYKNNIEKAELQNQNLGLRNINQGIMNQYWAKQRDWYERQIIGNIIMKSLPSFR